MYLIHFGDNSSRLRFGLPVNGITSFLRKSGIASFLREEELCFYASFTDEIFIL
jgi:hypothetical protein